jgi:hypothetical protein
MTESKQLRLQCFSSAWPANSGELMWLDGRQFSQQPTSYIVQVNSAVQIMLPVCWVPVCSDSLRVHQHHDSVPQCTGICHMH